MKLALLAILVACLLVSVRANVSTVDHAPNITGPCTDIPPNENLSCNDVKEFSFCHDFFMTDNGFCLRTCGWCKGGDDAAANSLAEAPAPAPEGAPARGGKGDVTDIPYAQQQAVTIQADGAGGPHWQPSAWEPCPLLCGAAVSRSRQLVCQDEDTDGLFVPDTYCPVDERPATSKPCGTLSCEGLGVAITVPTSECSATCGGGVQAVFDQCLSAELSHYLLPATVCSGQEECQLWSSRVDCLYPGGVQSCNEQPCNESIWRFGDWGECNALCGGGVQARNIECASQDGRVDPEGACGPLPGPRDRACNTAPCSPAAWAVGSWSEECREGLRARTVQCVSSKNSTALLGGECTAPVPRAAEVCAVPRVRKSKSTECTTDVLDSAGACCGTGVVSKLGECCSKASDVLDRAGACCPSGSVDACGVCFGSALAVDAVGACCETLLDAGGLCCTSSRVDECGVCDGDGTSCRILLNVTALVASAGELEEVIPPLTEHLASALGLSLVSVRFTGATEAEELPGGVRLQASYVLLPTPSLQLGTVVAALAGRAAVAPSAPAAEGTNGGQSGKMLQLAGYPSSEGAGEATGSSPAVSVTLNDVVRQPLCGNGFCEAGERPAILGAGLGLSSCAQDCPLPFLQCPASEGFTGTNDQFETCSRHGRCLSAVGACDCYEGHAGSGCERCEYGWVRSGDLCVRDVRVALPDKPLVPPQGLAPPTALGNGTDPADSEADSLLYQIFVGKALEMF